MSVPPAAHGIAVVLCRPRFPENIGAAARAALNMGITELVVVSPESYDLDRVRKMATHTAREVVERIQVHDDLQSALAPFSYVFGTTARLGGQRAVIHSPEKMAATIAAMVAENSVAVVFGPEDRGLSNSDLRLCHQLVNIPTADFSSLNLAQAVMVVCYEINKALAARPPAERGGQTLPRLATRQELDGMYEQVKELLVRVDYINPENPDYWMNKLRHFFTRMQLRAGEVSILRGICRQVNWYSEKRYRDGLAAAGEKESSCD